MKYYKTKKDDELYYYFNAKGEKLYRYRHRYNDSLDNRTERSRQGFKREIVAYRELLEVRTSTSNGDTKHLENDQLTLDAWLGLWYETKKKGWEDSTQRLRRRSIDDIIKPLIGSYKLSKLDAMTYERVFINKLLEDYAPSTVQMHHNIFKISVNAAVENKIIRENNFSSITIPDRRKKKENFLSQTALDLVLSAGKFVATITMYTVLLVIASTGMRKGEAQGLKWKDIDYEKTTIKIERTRDQDGVRPPKTDNSYRNIPVDDIIVKQLLSYHIWCKELKFSYGEHLNEDDYVFISREGGNPISNSGFNSALDRIIEKAKVKRITPHGLRHTHATILLNQKVSVATVAKRLGNTAEEIHRTYGHSDDTADREAVNIFSSVINM